MNITAAIWTYLNYFKDLLSLSAILIGLFAAIYWWRLNSADENWWIAEIIFWPETITR